MDMTGDRLIPAPRETVWAALNDPDVLKASIPGCESIEKLSDTELKAIASLKIGPINARFNGKVTLEDLDPPNGYNLNGEGQGGVAGFAKGGARVRLEEEQGATRLRYEVHAQIGGKMAQLGARLIDSTARSLSEKFFNNFSAQVAPQVEENVAEAEAAAVEAVPAEAASAETAPAEAASAGAGHGAESQAPAEHASTHVPAHADEDAGNPTVAGLPVGIWIPLVIAIVVVSIVLARFFG